MKQFYVKDLSTLSKYGFSQRENGRQSYICNLNRGTWNMGVDKDSHRLTFYSPSKECIALICEMYKNGDLEIFDDTEPPTINMKVSEEEMKMIYQHRKELNESEVKEND